MKHITAGVPHERQRLCSSHTFSALSPCFVSNRSEPSGSRSQQTLLHPWHKGHSGSSLNFNPARVKVASRR
jgi:hypothetical protein